ncbi:lysozyme inhibitor LprI family protein [Legionella cardiaca]|uniref:Lysozyme inhibitor LprI family protein n=1 Tax=Legionella cardiaca TaxID=1071983 RepID=A0ABY8ASA0_9GAMM|nr:lysozyme inhibitor LprI family protein [Legionella cardiaca]WED42370.1 lysozyme inhibitor LprI family protein [Legionella cardiaca]
MNKKIKSILIPFALFFSYPAFSLTPAEIKACYDKAMTTLAIHECANQEYSYYDKILNDTYKSLLSYLSPEGKTALVTSQKAWLDYRTKECKLMGLQHEGGSMQAIDEIDCYNTFNKKRIQDLKNYINSYSNQ